MKSCRHVHLLMLIFFGLLAVSSCQLVDGPCEKGKGDVVRRDFEIGTFSGVNMTMAGKVFIKQGEEVKVEVEGQTNILDELSGSIEGEVWTIYPRNCVSNYKELSIYITLPELNSLALTGSGTITTEDVFNNDVSILLSGSGQISYKGMLGMADIALTGSGKVTCVGDFQELTVTHSGSGSVALTGTTGFLKVACSGSGSIQAYEMTSTLAQVINSGSGSSMVYVVDELEAVINGSGSIFYKGTPAFVPDVVDTGSGGLVNAN